MGINHPRMDLSNILKGYLIIFLQILKRILQVDDTIS